MVFSQTLIFLPLLLSVGVVWGRATSVDEDRNTLEPFMTNSQKRRICVDLCLSGLGGTSCGTDCSDFIPQDLPIQFAEDDTTATNLKKNVTRNESCDVLCKNNLGTPLCACDTVIINGDKKTEADFVQICGEFCVKFNYRLSGCQKCSIYKSFYTSEAFSQQSLTSNYRNVDWNAWCQTKCGKGDGGAACDCDRLPLY